jgi:hypothetical protein
MNTEGYDAAGHGQVLPYLVRSHTEPNNGRSLDHDTTVSDNDNTLDARLLTTPIFLMTGTVEYMFVDTLPGQMTSGGS